MVFAIIFSVVPDREEPVTVLIHTIPYINFKVAMVILQLAVVWFGTKVSWKKLKFPKYFTKDAFISFAWAHLILQSITMVLSNIAIINALGDPNLEGNGVWWNVHTNQAMATFGDLITNKASFFLNILYPLIQSQLLSYRGYKNISNTHAVVFSIKNIMNMEGDYKKIVRKP